MIRRLILTLIALYSLVQCAPKVEPIDYQQARLQLLNELRPQFTGSWLMRSVAIKYARQQNLVDIGIKKDTLFTHLAKLTMAPVGRLTDSQQDSYKGVIEYNNKAYPVRIELMPGDWVYDGMGSKAYVSILYDTPEGYLYSIEPERDFLRAVGVVNDNFCVVELTISDKLMIWKGLNRGVERLELVKQ